MPYAVQHWNAIEPANAKNAKQGAEEIRELKAFLLKNRGMKYNVLSKEWAGGADPTGVADSYPAFQALFTALDAVIVNYASPFGLFRGFIPQVDIPAGRYKLSQEVTSAFQYGIINADRASVEPLNIATFVGTRLFNFTSTWRTWIRGLSLYDCIRGLQMFNPNLDTGRNIIEYCDFEGHTDIAFHYNCTSSTLALKDIRWMYNKHDWDITVDQLISLGGWMYRGTPVTVDGDSGSYCHCGIADIIGLVGVPGPVGAGVDEIAYFANYDSLRITSSRFGGEPGAGAIVNNHSPSSQVYPYYSTEVVIRDTYVARNIELFGPIVRLFECPSIIELRNIRCTQEQTAIGFSSTVVPSAKMGTRNYSIIAEQLLQPISIFADVASRTALVPWMYENAIGNMTKFNITPGWREGTYLAANKAYIDINASFSDTGGDPSTSSLVEFSASINAAGSVRYRSRYVGILHTYVGFTGGVVTLFADLTPLVNPIIPGIALALTPTLTWQATGAAGNVGLDTAVADRTLRITFDNVSANEKGWFKVGELGVQRYFV